MTIYLCIKYKNNSYFECISFSSDEDCAKFYDTEVRSQNPILVSWVRIRSYIPKIFHKSIIWSELAKTFINVELV